MTTTGKTFIIQSKWNGFVLDQTPNSDQVTCYPFNGGPNQIWIVDNPFGDVFLKNVGSGNYLALSGPDNRVVVAGIPFPWSFKPLSKGFMFNICNDGRLCLDVKGNRNDVNPISYDEKSGTREASQEWFFLPFNNTTCTFQQMSMA